MVEKQAVPYSVEEPHLAVVVSGGALTMTTLFAVGVVQAEVPGAFTAGFVCEAGGEGWLTL
eukprot:11084898-Prorocentrum_lima.AAC.1